MEFSEEKSEAVHRAFVSSLCMSEDSKPLSKPMKGAMAYILRCQLRPGHRLDGWDWFLCGQSFGRAGGLGYGSTVPDVPCGAFDGRRYYSGTAAKRIFRHCKLSI